MNIKTRKFKLDQQIWYISYIDTKDNCQVCSGSGHIEYKGTWKCPKCYGSGCFHYKTPGTIMDAIIKNIVISILPERTFTSICALDKNGKYITLDGTEAFTSIEEANKMFNRKYGKRNE